MPDNPMTIEVAVTAEGNVSINIKDMPMGEDGWGHLMFSVNQAMDFIIALQHATVAAYKIAAAQNSTLN